MRRLLLLAISVASLAIGRPAWADVTSSLAFGGGYSVQSSDGASTHNGGALSYSMGIGSSPRDPVVIGGIFRGLTHLGLGTDISLALRGSTGAFARGDWGFAVDLGVVGRFWKSGTYGTWPLQGLVLVGAPWGINIGGGAQFFDLAGAKPLGIVGLLEIDLLRLTVYRQGRTDRTWHNPNPGGGLVE